MSNKKEIQVFADWEGLSEPTLMGTLLATTIRGKEVYSFQYDEDWLHSNTVQQIDPDLQLWSGPQYLKETKTNFGLFLDSSPDRWGRLLMRRREAALARNENRPVQTLQESDYLLGVFDGHRMGAIRFKLAGNEAFQNDNKEMASPPWASLRELEHVSLQLERDDAPTDPEYLNWLKMLVAPGSSLGGARPKASVVDAKDQLWIAKFPSINDDKDMGAWEMVVHQIAVNSGVNVSPAMAQKFSGRHHTFLTQRFDRTATGRRLHFASAMTMLGYTDGTDHQDGASYLELAEFLMRNGAQADRDLEELWRRIVLNICVRNTDDHLRNHGFILAENGWKLSPAYDLNPVEYGTGLKLNISEDENSLDLELAREVAIYFRLKEATASSIIEKILDAVSEWRKLAQKLGISHREQEMMEPAFMVR